jgi:hypothetical protein
MIKLILGKQNAIGGLITKIDDAMITSDAVDTESITTSLLKLLSRNRSELTDPNLADRLTIDDLKTSTDYAALREVLRDSRLTFVLVDVMEEVGNEEAASFHIIITNTNANSLVKPGVIYHVNPGQLNELNIIKDVVDRFSLFPNSLYPDCSFRRTFDSELALQSAGLSHTEYSMVIIKNTLERIGFQYAIIKD